MRTSVRNLFTRRWLLSLVLAHLLWGCTSPDVLTPAQRLQAAGKLASQLLQEIRQAETALRYSEALVLADSLIRIAPELPDGHFLRGHVLLKLYQLEAADESFARATQLDPYHRGAWYQRGHVAFEQGRYRESARRYSKQREVIVDSPPVLKDFHAAADQSAIPQTWLQVGRAYQLLFRPDSARMAFEEVLKIDSTHAQANAWLSELYDEQGETEQALLLARRAWVADRRNPDFAYKVGTLLFKSGDLTGALPLLEWTAQAEPWNAGVHYNLGRVLVALGRSDEGNEHLRLTDVLQDLDQEIDQARAAAARFPNDPARWRTVAELLGRAGRRAEQREALSIARSVTQRRDAESSVGQSESVKLKTQDDNEDERA